MIMTRGNNTNIGQEKRKSLKTRFIIVISLLICIILASVGYVINRQVRNQMIKQMKKKGEALAKNIASNSEEAILTGDELSLGVYVDKITEDKSVVFAMILDHNGKVITHSDLKIQKGFLFDDMNSLNVINSDGPLIQYSYSKE